MKTIIHVCQQTIARNRKWGMNDPPLIVRTYQGAFRCQIATIEGPSEIKHSPHKPLKCGARVWVETQSTVRTK
jgi:hypothetical protein